MSAYSNLWSFIESYLPDYYSRDDVLKSDILFRYINSEELSKEDKQYIESNYKDIEAVITDSLNIEKQLAIEAMENYYALNYVD